MSIFKKLFRKKAQLPTKLADESPGKLMILGIIVMSNEIFGDDSKNFRNRKEQTFELIILSTLLILRRFRKLKPEYYVAFEDDLLDQISLFARQEHIIPMLPVDYAVFVNSRFALYDNEFTLDEDGEVKLPVRTAFNFFERPLTTNGGISDDLFKVLELHVKFPIYYESLLGSLYFMISKKYA
jgi:hypothetical protein